MTRRPEGASQDATHEKPVVVLLLFNKKCSLRPKDKAKMFSLNVYLDNYNI